jgi:hypothetical protein
MSELLQHPILGRVPLPDGGAFVFVDVAPTDTLSFAGSGAEAWSIALSFKDGMARLIAADLPAATKRDIFVVSRQVVIAKLGVPEHLIGPLPHLYSSIEAAHNALAIQH